MPTLRPCTEKTKPQIYTNFGLILRALYGFLYADVDKSTSDTKMD